jgi:hypothetical protein
MEDQLEAEAMKEGLTPERFLEFYKALAKRTQIHQQYQELNDLLTKMGQDFGWAALEPLMKEYPAGFERWDSMIHGWAMAEPKAATDFINSLPEDNPRYGAALNGLIWGLAVKDGDYAGKVLLGLSEQDRSAVISSFSKSFVAAHGPDALSKWCEGAPVDIAASVLAIGSEVVGHGAPADAVQWFTKHVEVLGIEGNLTRAFDQWLAASPSEARQWLENLPASQPQRMELITNLGVRAGLK